MAVFTKLQTHEINKILGNYNLGQLKKFHGIKQGVENTNYFIKTDKKKIILTIFEKRVQTKDVPFFVNLMLHMNRGGFKCPKPLENKDKKIIFKIKNKNAILVSFLEGKSKKQLTPADCKIVGQQIAKFHKISSKFSKTRKNTLASATWVKIYNQTKKDYPQYSKPLKIYIDFYKKNKPKKLSKGIIHADLFPDNIFFKNKKFVGFIDFYFSCNGSYLYELAIAINALCFQNNKIKKINIKKLIEGYSTIKKLKLNDLNKINILCLGAAIRYFVTRLYDLKNTPKHAKIQKKDPKEYLFKMKYFYQNINNNIYD